MNKKSITAIAASLIMTGTFAAESNMPNDAEITKIVNVTNEGEIELAKLAKKKTKNDQVKTFADHMISEHTDNNKNSMQLVRKLNLKPEKNENSEAMKKDSEKTMAQIKDLEGSAFDKAYMESQISTHQKVLSELDEKMIPSAKNPELKALLEKTKSSVTAHLEQAKKVQSSIQ